MAEKVMVIDDAELQRRTRIMRTIDQMVDLERVASTELGVNFVVPISNMHHMPSFTPEEKPNRLLSIIQSPRPRSIQFLTASVKPGKASFSVVNIEEEGSNIPVVISVNSQAWKSPLRGETLISGIETTFDFELPEDVENGTIRFNVMTNLEDEQTRLFVVVEPPTPPKSEPERIPAWGNEGDC